MCIRDSANHMKILRAMWDENPDTIFPRIQAPTLYVLAEPSGATDMQPDGFLAAKRQGIQTARERMTQAPTVEVIWARDTVHDIPLQRPEELAGWIGDFLRNSQV